jgi:hypothetical protein
MTVTDAEWMMAGLYFAALMAGGTLLMTTLARRTLSKLERRGR